VKDVWNCTPVRFAWLAASESAVQKGMSENLITTIVGAAAPAIK
jgi:hypothetical protein